MCILLFDVFV